MKKHQTSKSRQSLPTLDLAMANAQAFRQGLMSPGQAYQVPAVWPNIEKTKDVLSGGGKKRQLQGSGVDIPIDVPTAPKQKLPQKPQTQKMESDGPGGPNGDPPKNKKDSTPNIPKWRAPDKRHNARNVNQKTTKHSVNTLYDSKMVNIKDDMASINSGSILKQEKKHDGIYYHLENGNVYKTHVDITKSDKTKNDMGGETR